MRARFSPREPRRGSIAVLAALLLVFVMAMVAFAVDMGYICVVQTQAQAAADGAAMAGAMNISAGSATMVSKAKACAGLNSANGGTISLQNSDVVMGTWNSTARTFTAGSSGNAVQVTVNLTSARGNPVSLFFARVLGLTSENVTASAVATASRWDVVIAQDISSSYDADLSYAVTGHQTLLTDFNSSSPNSYLGVAQHTGWGSTWAALQQVGSNYSTLNATMGSMADCANNTTSAYDVYGGTATSIAVTTQTPACSGSDLATGIQQAINMFDSSAYTAHSPSGTEKAIIISSDGESNASSAGQHPSSTYSDTQLNTLAQTTAAAAWAQGISVYVVFYYHGSDSDADTTLLQSLVEGNGTFTMTTSASSIPTSMDSLFQNNLTYGVVQ